LSQAVLNAYLSELEDYNLYKRNSRGQRNARYLESQLREVKTKLTEAENNLEQYRLANQNWAYTTDPTILKESRRLRREVEILSQSYLNLMNRYEIARQESQNDLPVAAVLDRSSLPTLKSGPFRSIIVLLSGAAVFFMTVFVLLARVVYCHKTKVENNIYYRSLADDINRTISNTKRAFTIIRKKKKKVLTTADT